jgi:hypothetical protein
MLFVSELRKAIDVAIAQIETTITGNNEYVRTDPGPGNMRYITEAGHLKLIQIFNDMRCREDEIHDAKLDAWVIAPNMPKVVTMQNWQLDGVDADEIQVGIDWLKANRMNMISWMAYIYELSAEASDSNTNYIFTNSNYRLLSMSSVKYVIQADRADLDLVNRMDQSQYIRSLKAMRNVKITKESYIKAATWHLMAIRDMEKLAMGKKAAGINKLFSERPSELEASERIAVRDSARAIFDRIKNGLSSRTWGFEIEVPDAKGVDAPRGIEKGDDGSLRSENHSDCECDCNDCAYHECNCDNCDYGSDDPQHCSDDYCTGSVDSAEFRSTGGIQRVLHVGMIELCDKLVEEDAEINSSAGTHIHVYGQDLSTNQVGHVLATYHWLYNNIFWPIAGRNNNQYAKPLNTGDIANALRSKNPTLRAEKPLVVNVTNLLNGRGTIEFRHQNCNLDSKLISVWAWLVRGLVEVAKRGATFAQFKECKSVEDMVAVYAKFNFTPESENPGLVIVGSRSDEDRVEKVTHKQLVRS